MQDPIELLTRMLEIYSPSGKEEEMAQFVASEMEKRGFKVRIDEAKNVIGEVGEGEPIILFCGHLDTVVGEVPVRIKNGKLYGRGAVDAKGPLAACIVAISNFAPKRKMGRIIVVACTEEESTGKGVKHFIRVNPELKIDYAILGEPSSIDRITVGYRGRVQLTFACKTMGGHAGASWLYTNAVEESYRLWERLREKWTREVPEDRFHSMSVSITRMIGGEYHNIIPSHCEMTIDVRIPPGISCESIIEDVRSILKEYEGRESPTFSMRVEDALEAFEADPSSPLVRSLERAIKEITGRAVIITRKTGASDMALLGEKTKSIVAYGPGDPRSEHTVNEYIDIPEFLLSIKVYERLLELLLSTEQL